MNIGLVNLIVSTQLKEAYFNEPLLVETKKNASKFLDIVKNSPILQLEFKVFNNIENKHIVNEMLGMRYIDDNIKLFEVYTIEEMEREHEKLKPFINENVDLDTKKIKLYESVWSLIKESLIDKEEVNVDNIHECFDYVLNHIKTKKISDQKQVPENINEEVIEIAIDKFNEKYEKMALDEVKLFKRLIESNENEKENLFEEYKNENLSILNELKNENNSEKINKSIQKLNEMVFNVESVDDDIITLHELKKGLS